MGAGGALKSMPVDHQLLDELNRIVSRQQMQIDRLQCELDRLRQQYDSEGPGAGTRNLRDEIPPHW